MKALIWVLVIIAVAVAAFFFIRSKVEPGFEVESVDKLNKTGLFKFSGIQNSFGTSEAKSVSGRNGYVVTTASTDGKVVIFNLYKDGNLIRELQRVDFS